MSANELKEEIKKSLDNVPESILNDVLNLLRQAENLPEAKVGLINHLKIILSEDMHLLERLAK